MVNKFSTKDMNIEERLDFIEFRQELLFNNTEVSRLLFDHNVTREQYLDIQNVMVEIRHEIEKGNKTLDVSFEQRVYEIVPHLGGNYKFCESLVKGYKNQGNWEEVFEALYKDV